MSPQPPGAAGEAFAVASRRVIRFGAVYAFVVVATAALGFAGYAAISSGAADPTSVGTQASVLLGATVTGLVDLVCIIGLVVSTIVWIVSAHKLRPVGPGVVGYLGMALFLVVIGLSYTLPSRVPSVNGSIAVQAALSAAAVVILIADVKVVRSQVRTETGLDIPARRQTMQVSSDDWNAAKWDPEVLDEIDRGRGSEDR
jgi:hypothetical protein